MNLWERFHKEACEHVDEEIFTRRKVPHFTKGSMPHKAWLEEYDKKIEELNRKFFG